MLVTVDKIRRAAEHFVERRELHQQFGADDFRIEPPQQACAQEFRKSQKHAALERLKVHRQWTKRSRYSDVQADCATGTVRCDTSKRAGFVAADRRSNHHHRGGIETTALDQVANSAVDAGADAI